MIKYSVFPLFCHFHLLAIQTFKSIYRSICSIKFYFKTIFFFSVYFYLYLYKQSLFGVFFPSDLHSYQLLSHPFVFFCPSPLSLFSIFITVIYRRKKIIGEKTQKFLSFFFIGKFKFIALKRYSLNKLE